MKRVIVSFIDFGCNVDSYWRLAVVGKISIPITLFWVSALIGLWPGAAYAAKCLYVSSYHPEYKWDQGIRRGLMPLLKDNCEFTTFFMDTKRNQQKDFGEAKALEALKLIRTMKPDVVIAADDNASRFLVAPHLRDSDIPVVFCGINDSAKPYGYPYSNATGMVEITPHRPLLLAINGVLPKTRSGLFLAADVMSQRRMYSRLQERFAHGGIKLASRFVTTQDDWESVWNNPDRQGFIFIGNPAGIEDWDRERAHQFMSSNHNIFTLSAWDWMAPLAMVTVTKEPEEQGEWAAKVTLEILNKNASPKDIPVVVNRRWRMLVNPERLQQAGFKLPVTIQHVTEVVKP